MAGTCDAEQAAGEQPVDRPAGVRGPNRPVGVRDLADRRPPRQPVEQGRHALGGAGQQVGEYRRVGEVLRDRGEGRGGIGARREAEILGEFGEPLRRAAVEGLGERWAEAGRVRAEDVADRPDQEEPSGRAPHQAERAEPVEHGGRRGAPEPADLAGRHRFAEEGEDVEDLQGGGVERVHDPLHARPGGRAAGERGQIRR